MARILRKQTLSMRGDAVDFGALTAAHAKQRTLGNTQTNVRGDVLGDNGVILKTQEQIQHERDMLSQMQQSVVKRADVKQVMDTLRPDADIAFPTIQDLVKDGVIPPVNSKKAKGS
jgi:hypothetical protein